MSKITKKISIIFILAIFMFSFAFTLHNNINVLAQNINTNKLKCPEHNFNTNYTTGARNEEVVLIQKILNADYRTKVNFDGKLGGPEMETTLYGIGTREALKRFQALFIELVGVADGKFNTKTRTVMNAICKSPYFTNGTGNVYDSITTNTTVNANNLPINITGPQIASYNTPFRVFISGDKAIKMPDINGFIVEGGATLSDIRKENANTYKVLVTPTQKVNHTIKIQYEAGRLQAEDDSKNTNASNQWNISMTETGLAVDNNPLIVSISGPSTGYTDEDYKVIVTGNKAMKMPAVEKFIIDGNAEITRVYKNDQNTYVAVIRPTKVESNILSISLGAEAVEDLSGNKNLSSSNITTINLMQRPAGPDIVAPTIILSYPVGTIVGTPYRMALISSESLASSSPVILDAFLTTGPITLSDIQKIDDSTYSVLVSSDSASAYTANVQFKAGYVADAAGNKNLASNNLSISVLDKPVVASAGGGVSSGGDSGSSSLSPMNLLMYGLLGKQLLSGLGGLFGSGGMSGLFSGSGAASGASSAAGAAAGALQIGGFTTVPGLCMCPEILGVPNPNFGQPTIGFIPKGTLGLPGAYMNRVLAVPGGCVIGFYNPPVPPTCGMQYIPATKTTPSKCISPNSDSKGTPLVGMFTPGVTMVAPCVQ